MPLYTYQCSTCGRKQTEFRKIADRDRVIVCECCLPHTRLPHDPVVEGFVTKMHRIIEAPMVAPDIGPYQAVAVDVATGCAPVINSRSAHRDFLKRNGYTEVGTESVGRRPGEVRGDFDLRGDLAAATREVLEKQR